MLECPKFDHQQRHHRAKFGFERNFSINCGMLESDETRPYFEKEFLSVSLWNAFQILLIHSITYIEIIYV